jgi:hypothetical protein
MRMNISVPDELAEEVRQRDLPISAICQRALREAVGQEQAVEQATDILVFREFEQADPDPRTWPGFDPARPHLVYGRHPGYGLGWGLFYDSSAESHFIDGEADDAAGALSQARRWLRLIGRSESPMTDLEAVAERLRGTRAADAEAEASLAAKARAYGAKWARMSATAAELEYLAAIDPADEAAQVPVSLVIFMSSEHDREHRLSGREGMPGPSGLPGGPSDRYWPDLLEGAREVWEAVEPLLSQCGDVSPLSGGRPCALPAGHDGSHRDSAEDAQHVWEQRRG